MIYRFDVCGRQEIDPTGVSLRKQIADVGITVGPITTSRVFLIDSPDPTDRVTAAAGGLLADPIVETATHMTRPPDDSGRSRVEIHFKPGVMDPVAASTATALRDLGLHVNEVRTGRAYLIDGTIDRDTLLRLASRVLANGVIEQVYLEAFLPGQFQSVGDYKLELRRVALCRLSDADLTSLSREAHLFLSLAEMKAIQTYYRQQQREPTDIELETLAQTWSEHCGHKTLKSSVDLIVRDPAGKTLATRRYDNLIRQTIFQSTAELMSRETPGREFCLSVFSDNAGVIAFDELFGVCFKVETHNHPSAIEPYGGSATGIGGVIRDVLGTGLGAKPIANTDVFCVALPDQSSPLPHGVIHPKRVLQQVVAGVRDYGNRMGIPTVNGAVWFDDRYLGNPLVFCGCVGLIPRDKIRKAAAAGDAVVVVGGRTGRDGIHGATFSSAQLTDTHADEFSHAVQIGNAITEKQVADVILAARDRELFSAITDCGAGGLSSAVGEMAEKTGASVDLDRVPLKYAGLRYDEIWISEAQERMVLAVPKKHVEELLQLAADENVEATVIGTFGTEDRQLVLRYAGQEVGRLSMEFLHDGLPSPSRSAVVVTAPPASPAVERELSIDQFRDRLLNLLASPNIASKHWIIRQYDHEVQGGSVIKPLTGPLQIGPSDAAVLRPRLDSFRGVAIGCGLQPNIADPYDMVLAAVDEAVRNVVAVGAHPDRIALLDNFCWPSVDDELAMGTLVRAAEACHDAALAYGIPFISGKDSLHNQFTNQETGHVLKIPNTMLVSAIAVLDDVRRCVTMDLKFDVHAKVAVISPASSNPSPGDLARLHRAVAALLADGCVTACHDVSDGGIAVAAAEMAIASGLGLRLRLQIMGDQFAFAESPGRYLVQLSNSVSIEHLQERIGASGLVTKLGTTTTTPSVAIHTPAGHLLEISVADLTKAWRGTLDW